MECILVMNTVLNVAGPLGCAFVPVCAWQPYVQKKHWLIKSCADRNMYRVSNPVQSECFFFSILYDAG